jgi:hypothetical protein
MINLNQKEKYHEPKLTSERLSKIKEDIEKINSLSPSPRFGDKSHSSSRISSSRFSNSS